MFKETQLEQGLVSDRFASFSLKHSNNEKLEEKTLGEIYDQAEKGVFSKKLFIFNNGQRHYSERLHFFDSKRIFDQPAPSKHSKIMTAFSCKICKKTLHANIGVVTNLNAHLKTHLEFREKSLNNYEKCNGRDGILDEKTYDLVRYIVSSNTALDQLQNIHFAKLLANNMTLPGLKSFRYQTLPLVYSLMKDTIELKISKALSCCFITDIWTNKILADFIALAAIIVNESFEKELLVIGMAPMSGDHTAENVKFEIEKIVNSYSKFNKTLANG